MTTFGTPATDAGAGGTSGCRGDMLGTVASFRDDDAETGVEAASAVARNALPLGEWTLTTCEVGEVAASTAAAVAASADVSALAARPGSGDESYHP